MVSLLLGCLKVVFHALVQWWLVKPDVVSVVFQLIPQQRQKNGLCHQITWHIFVHAQIIPSFGQRHRSPHLFVTKVIYFPLLAPRTSAALHFRF